MSFSESGTEEVIPSQYIPFGTIIFSPPLLFGRQQNIFFLMKKTTCLASAEYERL